MITVVGIKTQSPDFTIGTIQDVVAYCDTKIELAVDTETEGLDFTSDKMIMFQIGDEEQQFVIDTRVVSIEPLRDILERRNTLKLLQNAKFDYKFMAHVMAMLMLPYLMEQGMKSDDYKNFMEQKHKKFN